MNDNSPIRPVFGSNQVSGNPVSRSHDKTQQPTGRSLPQAVYFMRPELALILNIYGRMVSAGQWRDYAIDHQKDQAVFSIFRRTSEMPLYRIVKEPARASQQGMWRIVGMDGRIAKRGHELKQLLHYFDRLLVKVLD